MVETHKRNRKIQ